MVSIVEKAESASFTQNQKIAARMFSLFSFYQYLHKFVFAFLCGV